MLRLVGDQRRRSVRLYTAVDGAWYCIQRNLARMLRRRSVEASYVWGSQCGRVAGGLHGVSLQSCSVVLSRKLVKSFRLEDQQVKVFMPRLDEKEVRLDSLESESSEPNRL